MSKLALELPPDEQRRMHGVLDDCPTVELPAGFVREGSELPDATVFVVEEGIALLVAGGEDRRRIVLALAEPGAVLVPPGADAGLTALTDARVTAVSRVAYDALLREPCAAAALTSALLNAVCDREESLAAFARFPYVERVRAKLLQLARTHGKVTEAGVVIDLPLTHDAIAEMVGSARETVTWALRQLTDEEGSSGGIAKQRQGGVRTGGKLGWLEGSAVSTARRCRRPPRSRTALWAPTPLCPGARWQKLTRMPSAVNGEEAMCRSDLVSRGSLSPGRRSRRSRSRRRSPTESSGLCEFWPRRARCPD